MQTYKKISYWDIDMALAADATRDPVVIANILYAIGRKLEYRAQQIIAGRDFVDNHPIVQLLSSTLMEISSTTINANFVTVTQQIHRLAEDTCRQMREELYEAQRGKKISSPR